MGPELVDWNEMMFLRDLEDVLTRLRVGVENGVHIHSRSCCENDWGTKEKNELFYELTAGIFDYAVKICPRFEDELRSACIRVTPQLCGNHSAQLEVFERFTDNRKRTLI
ncbi:hypothetical protein BDN70DRAFT_946051 [Pholiota conissans]|uniref:Uncharacterized protein n=1 Tax=Pholiota conissans TaxID=109636 RepID=A0A9P5YK46_9AGAR|nr:hypothetical protein BDN70DRAFT_946051 [Pholiota conissans]